MQMFQVLITDEEVTELHENVRPEEVGEINCGDAERLFERSDRPTDELNSTESTCSTNSTSQLANQRNEVIDIEDSFELEAGQDDGLNELEKIVGAANAADGHPVYPTDELRYRKDPIKRVHDEGVNTELFSYIVPQRGRWIS